MAALRLSATSHIATHSLKTLFGEKTVWLFILLFTVLVVLSAYLGWSANTTVDAIYTDAKQYLLKAGNPVPPNPVMDSSPLSMLRNLSVYFGLIGVLVAIVMGYQLIAEDRKSGVLPLIATRLTSRREYACAKVGVFSGVLALLTLISLLVCGLVFVCLPSISLSGSQLRQLFEFHFFAYAYMATFGLFAMGCTAFAKKQSIALLTPISLWLIITFILPSLMANVNPTAAINPISTLVPVPDSAFFTIVHGYLAPIALAQNFDAISAQLLEYGPILSPLPVIQWGSLICAFTLSALFAVEAIGRMRMEKGAFNE
ncbi:ABC-2 family transporter [Vibrio diazotrophicus]|uniref:ABC-2 family transporter n=1 Tax=Vibrio diazotrophicus TaxID=685 RepID=A0A329DZY6_VIBDI|nr:ABC transporter permease subunit [Vibrio diazotrophicus]RAS57090.1 ABC-2 family transporter [Vibrio diazotrophicus]